MAIRNHILTILILAVGLSLRSTDCDNIRLPDQLESQQHVLQQQQQQQLQLQQHPQQLLIQQQPNQQQLPIIEERRQGKHLLDLVGLGTGPNIDPYHAKTNANCLNGDLSECFKSQALGAFNDFFNKPAYTLSANARVIRLPENQYRSLDQEPYEFSSESRSEDSEWDQLVKFALRKVERFLKSTAIEVAIPQELTEGGRYSPRFISDEIADELDIIEDKKAPLFNRFKLKKLFIPLLIILKLFKLKLLLFLPLILGLASFKKLLGFLAIIIPGLFAYFKLCKPQTNFGGHGGGGGGGGIGGLFGGGGHNNYYSNGFPQYSPQGIGSASYYHHHNHIHESPTYYENNGGGGHQQYYRSEQNFAKPYGDYYNSNNFVQDNAGSGSSNVRFGENSAQNLAYQGYSEYRNNKN